MTSSIDRSVSERVFSNQIYQRTGAELKAMLHRQDEVDPYIKVRKSSIKNLAKWAARRQVDQRLEYREPQSSFAEAFWNGYLQALNEVLLMEKANGDSK